MFYSLFLRKIDLIKRDINSKVIQIIFLYRMTYQENMIFLLKVKMRNFVRIKVIHVSLLLFTLLLLFINTISLAQNLDTWLEEPVTVRCQNVPLSKVLGIMIAL